MSCCSNDTVIFVASDDSIVQTQTIRRMMMVEPYKSTVRVLYETDGAPHGAFLLSPAVNNRLMNELYALSEKAAGEPFARVTVKAIRDGGSERSRHTSSSKKFKSSKEASSRK